MLSIPVVQKVNIIVHCCIAYNIWRNYSVFYVYEKKRLEVINGKFSEM